MEGEDAEQDHRYGRDRVGLKQIGRHAGTVADVVAHIVGDRRRVTGVILGDARLDLALEVRANVGGLREDPAAESREDRDQRATEAETDERVDRCLGAVVEDRGQRAVVAGHAEQRESDNEHARDRTAAEGDLQRR